MWIDYPWEVRGVHLDPLGDVVHFPVLPGAEPEQDQIQMMSACLFYQFVDVREIELSGLWFHLFPVDGGFDRIYMHGLDGWPHFR